MYAPMLAIIRRLTSRGAKLQRWKSKPSPYTDWLVTVVSCSIVALIILIINVTVTIEAITRYGSGRQDIGTIFTGSCNKVNQADSAIHWAINALSTVLLAGSNYCMQVINAPTRRQIDEAHAKGKPAHVGVMRLTNLRWVGWKNVSIWFLLCLSSVPLHLLWNSAVFSSIRTHIYDVSIVPQNATQIFIKDGNYQRLDNEACIKAYTKRLLSDRRNLGLVVAGTEKLNHTEVISQHSNYSYTGIIHHDQAGTGDIAHSWNMINPPFNWVCDTLEVEKTLDKNQSMRLHGLRYYGAPCTSSVALSRLKDYGWKSPSGQNILYCLSEKVEQTCSLQFSKMIMVLVIICNGFKLIGMLAIISLGKFNSEQPLLTIGDAISSFMEQPAPKAVPIEGASKNYFDRWQASCSRRWIGAVGVDKFILAYLIPLGSIIAVSYCLNLGILEVGHLLRETGERWQSLPFGSVDIRALFNLNASYTSLATCAIIANIPQLVLSFCYFTYNRLYTSMLLSAEYDSYSLKRKPLRVSRPKGFQRSNYFLSLPYRWSIPLMGGSLMLHWLFSQSIFLVSIEQMGTADDAGIVDPLHGSTFFTDVGYCPLAILLSIVMSALMLIFGILVSTKKYHGTIPLAGSNTLAISAACHRPVDDVDGHLKPVQWGELSDAKNGPVRRCTFSSLGVAPARSDSV